MRLSEVLDAGRELPLGDDIDGVDVVGALGAVHIALVHGIDADVAESS